MNGQHWVAPKLHLWTSPQLQATTMMAYAADWPKHSQSLRAFQPRKYIRTTACATVPRVRDNGHVQSWFQITLSEVGSVRRACSISHIATMCWQRYRSFELNEAQSYLKLYWLAISMRHCRQWFFLCLTLPLPLFFFFPSSGLHYKEDGKVIFLLGVERGWWKM